MIVLIGDVHGEFALLRDKLSELHVTNSFFIQVGDFGVGFKSKEDETKELESLNKELQRKSNVMYVTRGNHDDPKRFRGNALFSNLHLLKDYSVLMLEGKNILLAGGAISIDRKRRVLNVSYWTEEGFAFEDKQFHETVKGLTHIDIIVTHNAPAEFQPTEMNQLVIEFGKIDTRLIFDLNKERRLHTKLMRALVNSKLAPSFWYYGHYHCSFQSEYEGIKYRVLDSMEFFKHK